jgi:hypothetical protein
MLFKIKIKLELALNEKDKFRRKLFLTKMQQKTLLFFIFKLEFSHSPPDTL